MITQSEAVNSDCPSSRAVNSVMWIIKTSLKSVVRFLWLLACLNRGSLLTGTILLLNFVLDDNESRWPLDDTHPKVSLRSCMSDDLCETSGFNTFRKERGTEEAALSWLQAQLKTG